MTIDSDKYALSPAWAHGREYKDPFDYTLESSGQTVFLKRLDMPDLLRLGAAEDLDFMAKALMSPDVKEGEEAPSVMSIIGKSDNFGKMEAMINLVVQAGVLAPRLYLPPTITETKTVDGKPVITTRINEAARQKGLTYVDSVPFDDRVELFGIIFDTDGLSTFREEQTTGVADVENVTSLPLPTE